MCVCVCVCGLVAVLEGRRDPGHESGVGRMVGGSPGRLLRVVPWQLRQESHRYDVVLLCMLQQCGLLETLSVLHGCMCKY